nr:DUF2163 domain-containing protein [Ancylobacter crimeensis]
MPEDFAALLASGVTTLARCWRLTRTDGVVVALTEHDDDLTVDGTAFRAIGGVAAAEMTAGLGFAVDGSEVSAALTSDLLDEADLAAGLFDGAAAELLLADWSAPTRFVLLRRFHVGEVRREDGAFTAELRSPADRLNEIRGRRFTSACDADLGDARCGIDLTLAAYRAAGTVLAVEGASLMAVSGLAAFASGWFGAGRFVLASGPAAGFACEVKTHRIEAGTVRIELWQRPPETLAAGDGFVVTAGCDKSFATCRDRFGNGRNFRGCPHMPGNDRILQIARAGG